MAKRNEDCLSIFDRISMAAASFGGICRALGHTATVVPRLSYLRDRRSLR
jgi:hypothetical protein